MEYENLLANLQPLDCFDRIDTATDLMERHLNCLVDLAESTYAEMVERARLANLVAHQPCFYPTAERRFHSAQLRYQQQFEDAQHCGDCLRHLHKLHDAAIRSRHLEFAAAPAA